MKIAVIITRTILGLIFLVFGLNFFLHFIPMDPATGKQDKGPLSKSVKILSFFGLNCHIT